MPVTGISYENPYGPEVEIRNYFPGDEERVIAYRSMGERTPVILHTHQTLFLRAWGLRQTDAVQLCNELPRERSPNPFV